MTDLAGVVLAAGAARRFGAPKLLHPLPDGSPIGVAAARTLARAVPATVVVVAAGDRRVIVP
ncbi:MAG: NTP transferase domain-containing protein [Gammaproteobacteria bacterium]